ncbi:MAG: hypothetical protein A3D34_00835 [Candidatus Staskawiczbacteria bacterium RIFCSPHIGHO2_02_FULL_33_16]|uniref:Enoyl reductase (ER) domain-containing protein n=1 Tax=Candidatus Staskawiczbacteria bacterium RIFCSPHIGHO2_02_FULL_33_16 TaxID=1802204 RepID=A0A1G2HXL6_9BACT|nr:MAG: hypothetical protein A3D34_00835 [Candidatus Staskawiczbacteria bacterium RIFCSPHIGHO2_02_FULL_33_16]
MKVAQINNYGHSGVIEITDVGKPKIEKGKVLVKVYASSINPFDTVMREGYVKTMMSNIPFPIILGGDIAGVAAEIGEGVENFSVGNKVYGQALVLAGGSGAFAEFALVLPEHISLAPKNLDFNQSAAIVLTGVSAVQGIIEHINLKTNQKILIHGGAGGIGTIAIQIAKSIGALVVTTATGQGIEYVKKLGADQVIDYKNSSFDEIVSDCDAVFDTVGADVYSKSFKVLKRGGIIVSMIAPKDEKLAEQFGVLAITQSTKVTAKNLEILTDFIENKNIKVHIDKVYLLDRIREAFDEKEKGDVLGKIVLEIQS